MKKLLTLSLAVLAFAALSARAEDAKAVYEKSCAKCHGADGKGQTKMGQKLGCKDYTDAKVQTDLTDAAATKAIKEGYKDSEWQNVDEARRRSLRRRYQGPGRLHPDVQEVTRVRITKDSPRAAGEKPIRRLAGSVFSRHGNLERKNYEHRANTREDAALRIFPKLAEPGRGCSFDGQFVLLPAAVRPRLPLALREPVHRLADVPGVAVLPVPGHPDERHRDYLATPAAKENRRGGAEVSD